MKRNFHPSGDNHWTRQPGVERTPWGKLTPDRIDALCACHRYGVPPGELSRIFHVSRPTVYRYLRRRGLIK